MNEKQENIKLIPKICPVISGIYTVTAKQNVKAPGRECYEADPLTIFAGCSRFSLEQTEVAAVYPPASACGKYGTTLPHIVLNKKTLPWEYENGASSGWLALLCLKEEEIEAVEQLTLKELTESASQTGSVFFPAFSLFPVELPEDSCQVLKVKRNTFEMLLPKKEEVALLCHVKEVDMHDKEDEKTAHDGLFSVVTANRFVPTAQKEPVRSRAFLVSVAGYGPYLKDKDSHAEKSITADAVRLVVLYSWNILSASDKSPGFRTVFQQLKAGALDVGRQEPEALARGYVPRIHSTRTGEETVSLYRGPCVPYDTAKDHMTDLKTYSADGQIIYDPENGMFDMSYAAAWQIGRLLTLQNKSIANEIFMWRRNLLKLCCIRENDAVRRKRMGMLGTENQPEFLDYFFHELYPKLVKGEITALAEEGREADEIMGRKPG